MKRRYKYPDFKVEIVSKTEEVLYSDEYTVILIVQGDPAACIYDREIALHAGDVLVNNAHVRMRIASERDDIYGKIIFQEDILKKYISYKPLQFWCAPSPDTQKEYESLRILIRQILVDAISQPELPFRLLQAFYHMLELLCTYFTCESAAFSNVTREDDRICIVRYMEEHYMQAITLQEISECTNIPYYYLSRNFYPMFGKKFYDLLNEIRLRHVIEDLLYTDKNMTRIAWDNGFGSLSSFNRNFRTEFGMSPQEYKRYINIRCSTESDDLTTIINEAAGVLSSENEGIIQPVNQRICMYADLSEPKTFHNVFQTMINGGHAADLCSAHLQRQIIALCRELRFSMVRFYDPFCSEMEIRKDHGMNQVNFRKLDSILDVLVNNGITPWIDFGEKPNSIIGDDAGRLASLKEKGVGYLSKSEFLLLLEKFVVHLVERYGGDETGHWVFEFWNREYRNESVELQDTEDYLDFFDRAYEVIKKYIPEAFVGGDGMLLIQPFADILRDGATHKKPDFLSTVFFLYDNPWICEENSEKRRTGEEQERLFINALTAFRQDMEKYDFKCPLCVCEFSSTVSNRDYQNDSCYQATYFLMNALRAESLADLVGAWCASDFPFLAYDVEGPLFGGSGLVTVDGLKKPVWYAFDFLRRLYPWKVGSCQNAVLTTDQKGNYALAAYHFQNMEYEYYLHPGVRREIRQHMAEGGQPLTIDVMIPGMANGVYNCLIWRVGSTDGNLLYEWEKLGFPKTLTETELIYLEKVTIPRLEKRVIEVRAGVLRTELTIACREIVLMQLRVA